MTYFLLALIGLIGGMLSGLFGVGGGVIFVPFLILLKAYDPHVAIGTSLVIVIPTVLIGVWRHQQAGMVDWKVLPFILIFAMAGAWIGAHLSLQLESGLLRKLFAGFLVLIALKLFFTK